MFERYHVPIKSVPGRVNPVPKFEIIRADNCVNCGKCERSCIYGVHKRSDQDFRKMAEPLNQLCKNCFRCIEECPQRSLTMVLGADFKSLGRGIWTSQRIMTIWGEAETGKIPVFGAGYRGMFAGPGFDGMWTDMSEIVRPTRDGIHGREYISTSVDVGRKPSLLEFGKDGSLETKMPPIIEQPIPMLLDTTRIRPQSEELLQGFALAAKHLDTIIMVPSESISLLSRSQLNGRLVPVFQSDFDPGVIDLPKDVKMVELPFSPSWKSDLKALKSRYPDLVVGFRIPGRKEAEKIVLDLVRGKAEVVHILYDEEGEEDDKGESRHAKDSLKRIHKALVAKSVRDEITIIVSGGIAAAEHVPKSIICGADAVALEKALVIALECRNCVTCSLGSCPANLSSAPAEWIEGRVTNMIGAWKDQMLEVLGAMGLREVRRLRGEFGRAIFFEDVERESFADIKGGMTDG